VAGMEANWVELLQGTPIHVLTEHVGFVQGVNFDPMGEFVATISTDRY